MLLDEVDSSVNWVLLNVLELSDEDSDVEKVDVESARLERMVSRLNSTNNSKRNVSEVTTNFFNFMFLTFAFNLKNVTVLRLSFKLVQGKCFSPSRKSNILSVAKQIS